LKGEFLYKIIYFYIDCDLNGCTFRSNFTVGELLGSGNFGSVYIGEAEGLFHPGSLTKVAIKTVNNALDGSQVLNFCSYFSSKNRNKNFFLFHSWLLYFVR